MLLMGVETIRMLIAELGIESFEEFVGQRIQSYNLGDSPFSSMLFGISCIPERLLEQTDDGQNLMPKQNKEYLPVLSARPQLRLVQPE